ncbi:Hypothetical predicted protein [Cloeon dipterum]|uniref:Translational activator of cytochrome c oxidase 1 n=1 Tax=Cloeon dipterum TaxID=197152 RepID=A0A8S1DJR8_9INSE|nr:Hypothetical predicted protein [Cloeon dipterum]
MCNFLQIKVNGICVFFRFHMSRLLLSLTGSLCQRASGIMAFKRCAGHSKWQNIRHIKALKDSQKSNMFQKYSQQIKGAIIEAGGNADLKTNSKLRNIIDQAKKSNMTVDAIERVITRAKQSQDLGKSAFVELKGPGGCWLILSVVTNNVNSLKSQLKGVYRKCLFQESSGGAKSLFEHKGFVVAKPKSGPPSVEASLEHAIEAGAEDVIFREEDGLLEFQCDPADLLQVQALIMQFKYDVIESSNRFIPHSKVKLPDDVLMAISDMCDNLLQLPEVVEISDNIE